MRDDVREGSVALGSVMFNGLMTSEARYKARY
jgi:hypothetical protein